MHRRLNQLVTVEPGEMRPLFWSFTYFFSLLCSYYIIRPMRDEMGIAGGVDKLQWMFTGTFLVMLAAVPLFGWVARRFPVRRFLPYVYYFFIANLALFFVLFKANATDAYVARAFFIWASVFNFTYNIGNRAAEDNLLPLAADRGIATLINRPFQRGALFRKVKGKALPEWTGEFDCDSWAQFFLKYVVSHPAVTCAIPATSKVHHMEDNMAANFGKLPSTSMRKRMLQYFESL